jgi:hypothetical protein
MGFAIFTMIPMWGSICLGRVNLAYSRTTVKIPKLLGAASKHYVASLEHLHPTPANTPFHQILQQDTVTCAVVLYSHPFCSGHFNPFKSYFLLWIWTCSDYEWSRCKDMNGFRVLKGTFMTFVGGDSDH